MTKKQSRRQRSRKRLIDDDNEKYPLRIRRQLLNLTQREIGDKLGVDSGTISNIELGKVNPTPYLIRLASVLECKPQELFTLPNGHRKDVAQEIAKKNYCEEEITKDNLFNKKLKHWEHLSSLTREELIGLCMTYRFNGEKNVL